MKYTVIGFYDSTARVFAFHVEAVDVWEAYKVAGQSMGDYVGAAVDLLAHNDEKSIVEVRSEANFVACVPRWVEVTAPCDESGNVCGVEDYMGEGV